MTKRRVISGVGLILSLLVATLSFAQASPEKAERVLIGGKEFWVHDVQRNETLYGISRAYGVAQTVIASYNPEIYLGLKTGQRLKIPVPDDQRQMRSDTVTDYRIHIVAIGETLYAISKNYGITIRSIRLANPQLEETLKEGEILRIPNGEYPPDREKEPGFLEYQVQAGEGLFGIAQRHNLKVEDIIQANPDLRRRGLVSGEVIRIPLAQDRMSEQNANYWPSVEGQSTYPVAQDMCDTTRNLPKDIPLNIALILPFNTSSKDSSSYLPDNGDVDFSPDDAGKNETDKRFLEFYEGFLLGVERFQQLGYSINLNVFDSRQGEYQMKMLANSDTLQDMQLIVGPVRPQELSYISRYAGMRRINLVSPLSSNTKISDPNPYLFAAMPSHETQQLLVVQKLLHDGQRRFVIIRDRDDLESAQKVEILQLMFRAEFAQMGSQDTLNVEVVDFQVGEPLEDLKKSMPDKDGKTTMEILIPSEREPFISDLLGKLNALRVSARRTFEVYGMPKWRKFSNLDFNQLTALNVTVFAPSYVDYQRNVVNDFIENYRATYRAEPSQFSFQGYDLATYFLSALTQYGEDFRFCLKHIKEDLLQNQFNFQQIYSTMPYENRQVRLLRFDRMRGLQAID